MIFNKGNYKIYLGLVLTFAVGCDGKVITNNSKDIDLINKFCLNKEPNVNLDINKYLPSESSMENPIKKNLGISVVNFFDKIQNGKALDNMNIYENQGYIDIIGNNYDSIGRIIIIPDGKYVKYINLEVRSAPDIFKKEILKKTIVDVINVFNNHGDSEIAYNKMLEDLLVNMKNGVFNLKMVSIQVLLKIMKLYMRFQQLIKNLLLLKLVMVKLRMLIVKLENTMIIVI